MPPFKSKPSVVLWSCVVVALGCSSESQGVEHASAGGASGQPAEARAGTSSLGGSVLGPGGSAAGGDAPGSAGSNGDPVSAGGGTGGGGGVTFGGGPSGGVGALLPPGAVAFWTFGEAGGEARKSIGTAEEHPLTEVGGPIARIEGGPFSGYSAHFDGKQYLRIPYAEAGDLNISGKDAKLSMFAVIKLDELSRGVTVAGIWSEGKGANDDTGTRQYAMLINMPNYGGRNQLTPHVSSEGGVSRRADGTGLPWCVDYAASRSTVPVGTWVTLGFTYDGSWVRAYFNGVMEERTVDPAKDGRTDRYFTTEGEKGGNRGINPYFHGRGIFRYDPALHAQSKPGGGADFMIGARYAVGSLLGESFKGTMGGLAVFSRALSDAEMKALHDQANLAGLK